MPARARASSFNFVFYLVNFTFGKSNMKYEYRGIKANLTRGKIIVFKRMAADRATKFNLTQDAIHR